MKLSVIIPFYNNAQTLKRCVESVISQQLGDMELILVDDGSTDGSASLVKDLPGVKLISKENGGLSDARNAGLEQATGDYVTFVDADDYLAAYTYKPLMDVLAKHPEYDITEFSVKKFDAKGFLQPCFITPNMVYTDAKEYWLKSKAYNHAYAWNKIYRRALFEGVRYPVGRIFEDVYTLPDLLHKAKVIAQVPTGYYCYCFSHDSITAKARGNEYRQLLEGQLRVMQYWVDRDFYKAALNIQLLCYDMGCDGILLPRMFFRDCNMKLLMVELFGVGFTCRLHRILYKLWLHRRYDRYLKQGYR